MQQEEAKREEANKQAVILQQHPHSDYNSQQYIAIVFCVAVARHIVY